MRDVNYDGDFHRIEGVKSEVIQPILFFENVKCIG